MQNFILLIVLLKIYLFLPAKDIYRSSFLFEDNLRVQRVAKKIRINNQEEDQLSVFESHIRQLYENCKLGNTQLDYRVFRKGVIGFYNLRNQELVCGRNLITIIDFSKPSTEERLWVLDLENKEVLFNTLVAHGKNSGENMALNFSNTPESNMSSLGFYLTQNTYEGMHGLSLVLEGVDENYNSNARERAIVMHGASYVSTEFIGCNGRLGRSLGCPALPMSLHDKIIKTIANGSVLYINHEDMLYDSDYLCVETAVEEFFEEKQQN